MNASTELKRLTMTRHANCGLTSTTTSAKYPPVIQGTSNACLTTTHKPCGANSTFAFLESLNAEYQLTKLIK